MSLPELRAVDGRYDEVRTRLLRSARNAEPLKRLQIEERDDWIVAYCDGWARVAEILTFYGERVMNEAFLATATQATSLTRIYHSFGHDLPPNATATTTLTYRLTDAASGVEAVARARSGASGASAAEQARRRHDGGSALDLGVRAPIQRGSQVKAIPAPDGRAPVFVTLEPLDAHVALTKLDVLLPGPPAAAPLAPAATEVELGGTKTGLAVGRPVVIAVADRSTGIDWRWIRVVTSIQVDQKRKSTRIGWDHPVGPLGDEPPPLVAPTVIGFATPSSLAGAGVAATDWSALALHAQLAEKTGTGDAVAVRDGLMSHVEPGDGWVAPTAGPPPGRIASICVHGRLVLAAGHAGVFRSDDGVSFTSAGLPGGARAVFVGGTPAHVLAGTDRGALYQSLDGAHTWDSVRGGPPTINPPPPAPSNQVVTYQLPTSPVRCALFSDPLGLVAGTDRGAFVYNGTDWNPASSEPTQILALANHDHVLVGGTPAGAVSVTDGRPYGDGLHARVVHALLVPSPSTELYAGTDAGLYRVSNATATWEAVSGGALAADTTVTSLAHVGGALFAGTPSGVLRSTDGGKTWEPFSRSLVLTKPARDVGDVEAGQVVPPGLVNAFADAGITLASDAVVSATPPLQVTTAAGDQFELVLVAGEWQAWLVDALDSVVALGASGNTVWAAAAPATAVADAWPGFAVVGSSLELSPAVRAAVPGEPALIQQLSGPAPLAQELTVEGVEQDRVTRFGQLGPVTRLELTEPLMRGFDRGTATVWTGGAQLPAFAPPVSAPTQLSGAEVVVAGDVVAAVTPGRLAAVTGSPVGLTVAPLGGALRLTATAMRAMGPAQADVRDIAVDDAGNAYLATAEGVFEAAPDGGEPVLLGAGSPDGTTGADAVVTCGTAVLAAFGGGLMRRGGTATTTPPRWRTAELAAPGVMALAVDGATAYAGTGDGVVHRCHDVLADPPLWDGLPALPAPARRLAARDGTLWAATDRGVFRLAGGTTWDPRPRGLAPAPVTGLVVADGGSVLAGSALGLQRLDQDASEWQTETLPHAGGVEALALEPGGRVVAGTDAGVMRRATDGSWSPLGDPAVDVSAIAATADGSVWVGARATRHIDSAGGGRGGALAHRALFSGVDARSRDIATLRQGGVPASIATAFANAGAALDTPTAVVASAGSAQNAWTIRCRGSLSIVAMRASPAGLSFSGFAAQAPVYPTAPPAPATTSNALPGAVIVSYPVELGGGQGTLRVRAETLVALAANKDAPTFAESVRVTGAEPADGAAGAATRLRLARPLVRLYDAATVTLSLNAVAAAQGTPATVPIGSGDPVVAHQSFAVPTPVAAVAPDSTSGAQPSTPATTLEVLVDDEPWSALPRLLAAGPTDRVYTTRTNADGSVIVQFGDGVHGARPPAGHDNVVARYLQGGGPGGEVSSGALVQALDRAQLVAGVHNPSAGLVPASPDRGSLRVAGVRSLDRVLTMGDVEDVAAAQPGVRSAAAELLTGPAGREIAVTVAPTGHAPTDLADRVRAALVAVAAPGMPVRVVAAVPVPVRLELAATTSGADVETPLRVVLAGLSAVKPGQPLLAAHVVAAASGVTGVEAVRIRVWGRAGAAPSDDTFVAAAGAHRRPGSPRLRGAELLTVDARAHMLSITTEVGPA